MGLLGGFSWLDFALLLALFVGFAIGYAQGLLRQGIGLAVLYIGAILGAQYFSVLAGAVRTYFPDVSSRFINAVAFFVILLGVTTLVNLLVMDAYRSTRIHFFPFIDRLWGAALGAVGAVVVISLLLPVIAFAAKEPWPWIEQVRLVFMNGMETSQLAGIFDGLKPVLLNALSPWLPGGLPSLFNL
jgi:uncharacterized membrane protein required for colicin V production